MVRVFIEIKTRKKMPGFRKVNLFPVFPHYNRKDMDYFAKLVSYCGYRI